MVDAVAWNNKEKNRGESHIKFHKIIIIFIIVVIIVKVFVRLIHSHCMNEYIAMYKNILFHVCIAT